jgi:hypothetical protein
MGKAKIAGQTREAIKRRTIADMKALGVHKPQYNRLIDTDAELVEQYNTLTDEFKASGYECEVATGDGGSKKSPIVATLENLRKDILAYSDRLCLNPQALKTKKPSGKGRSKLDQALSDLR